MAFSTHDQVPDSPTNTFATLNVLNPSSISVSDGNITLVTPNALTNNLFSTISFPNEGKWFFEILYISYQHHYSGIFNKTTGDSYQIYQQTFRTNGASTATLSTNSYSASSNSVIGLLINFENVQATVTIYINGTSVGGPYNITSGEYFAVFNDGASATGGTQIINFGQDHLFGGATLPSGAGSNTPDNGIGTFAFSVPTGALALCTANLPDPDIDPALDDVPEDYMKAVKYTGQTTADAGTWDSGTSTSTIAVGFQPDLVWLKNRDLTGTYHQVYDSVRGSAKVIFTNDTLGEYNRTDGLTNFNSNGFSLGTHSHNNNSGDKFIAWCWKAGGAPTTDNTATSGAMNANGSTATSSNSSVSIDGVLQSNYTPAGSPTIYPKRMSVNTKAGFSIIKYTGTGSAATVPHGLSATPEMVIIKNLDVNSTYWIVYHREHWEGSGANNVLLLPLTTVPSPNSTIFNSTQPSSSVVTLGTNGGVNTTSINYIMYCWHSVPGYSKFSSYTGNGSTDGPFVYTGFKPAWVMIKSADLTANWPVFDSARSPYNLVDGKIYANDSRDERVDSTDTLDILSNGFKLKRSDSSTNSSGTYIYAAFAEQPFKYATAR